MTISEINSQWILAATLASLVTGFALLLAGARARPYGGAIAAVALLTQFVVVAMAWSGRGGWAFEPLVLARGWILPAPDPAALTVGAFEDPLAYSFCALAPLLAALFALARLAGARGEARTERHLFSACAGAAAVTLSWISLTAWLALAGVVLATIAGFLAFGASWTDEAEAGVATRFARERVFGTVLALAGAFILLSTGADLSWRAGAWTASLAVREGAAFLLAGLTLHLHPFPLIGWTVRPVRAPAGARALFGQIFPAWCALAILVRLQPKLLDTEIFVTYGWIALAAAGLTAVTGLLQPDWRRAHAVWLSCGFTLAAAALALAGPWACVSIALATGLAGFAWPLAAASLAQPEADSQAPPAPSEAGAVLAARILAFVAAAAATGFVGFVSSGGTLQWLGSTFREPALVAAPGLVLFLASALAWRTAFLIAKARRRAAGHTVQLATGAVVVLLSLAAFWTGTATGGAVPDRADAISEAALSRLFAARPVLDAADFVNASAVAWGLLAAAIGLAWWTSGRKRDAWESLRESFPRTAGFVAGGYGVDRLFELLIIGLRRFGQILQSGVDEKAWNQWIPRGLDLALTRGARLIARGDRALTDRLGGALRQGVDVSGKMLQLIQSGDVQWYLFFAVGSGIAILVHFLKF